MEEVKRKAKVLCIDDEPIGLTVTARLLTSSGFEAITASDGMQGLEAARKCSPDLILLDAMMPGMDGYQVCIKLQKDPQTATIPVIFTTALAEEQDKIRAFAAGAVDYVTKPVRRDLIVSKITQHLDTKEQWQKIIRRGDRHATDYARFKRYLCNVMGLPPKERERCETIPPQDVYTMSILAGLGHREMAQLMADFLGFPYIAGIPGEAVTLGVLPTPFCIANLVVPVEEQGGKIAFILSNPFHWELLNVLGNLNRGAPKATSFYIAEPEVIDGFLSKKPPPESVRNGLQSLPIALEDAQRLDEILARYENNAPQSVLSAVPGSPEQGMPDTRIMRLAGSIIYDAYQRGASDIHIEPRLDMEPCEVRFRKDGECFKVMEIPTSFAQQLISRLKIMAQLDITEKRKPQDGKMALTQGGKKIEVRVAVIPSVGHQEDVVMRILASHEPIPLDKMFFLERNLTQLKELVLRPHGVILCVGPTGSGKTTTLHSCLGYINTPERKIWTAEDPVEITQRGLRQVQVQPKIGFTFANALRAFLRADPDVIMVGEMRDEETASVAIEASLTGHLVLSTLHTNSAPETIMRLLDMGLKAFNFADALNAILAQRLVRSLCSSCKQPYTPTNEELQEIRQGYGERAFDTWYDAQHPKPTTLYRPVGCDKCGERGYKGRIGIHELLVGTREVKDMIIRKERIDDIRELAMSQGMTTLLQDGVQKAFAGLTDLKSVRAVAMK